MPREMKPPAPIVISFLILAIAAANQFWSVDALGLSTRLTGMVRIATVIDEALTPFAGLYLIIVFAKYLERPPNDANK